MPHFVTLSKPFLSLFVEEVEERVGGGSPYSTFAPQYGQKFSPGSNSLPHCSQNRDINHYSFQKRDKLLTFFFTQISLQIAFKKL